MLDGTSYTAISDPDLLKIRTTMTEAATEFAGEPRPTINDSGELDYTRQDCGEVKGTAWSTFFAIGIAAFLGGAATGALLLGVIGR